MRQILSDPVARTKPCLRCERSLLKHLDDRFCPDCGLSVWMSLNANDALDRSRPEWLKRTSKGAWILAIAQPVALAAYVIAFIGHELPSWSSGLAEMDSDGEMTDPRFNPAAGHVGATTQSVEAAMAAASHAAAQPSIPVAIGLALIGIFFAISAVGLLRLTSNERRHPDRVHSTRIGVRIVAGIAAFIGLIALELGVTHLARGWLAHSAGAWMLLVLIEVTFAAVSFAGWLYLRPIARRGGRGSLAKLCGWLLFLPLLAFAKAAPFIGLWFLYLLMPLATLLPLAYLPLSTVLFVRFALLLQRAAPHAEAAWLAESKPTDVEIRS